MLRTLLAFAHFEHMACVLGVFSSAPVPRSRGMARSLVVVGLLLFAPSVMCSSLNAVKILEKTSKTSLLKILYPQGSGESQLPECDQWSVCSRVDTYSRPWVEKLCNCRNGLVCPSSLRPDDGHTILDRTRQYKVCESSDTLPTCRFFKDITWAHVTGPDNKFQQKVRCKCPANSTTYISGHDVKVTPQGMYYYYYYFSCSPESGMRCRRKEPCRLFTVRKRFPVEEVTTSTLCQCPPKTVCPSHHTDPFVVSEFDTRSRPRDGTRTYSGFCNVL